MRLHSIPRLWNRLRGLPPARRRLLLEAACSLAAARLAIQLLPFPRIARYLGRLRTAADGPGDPPEPPCRDGAATSREVAWAIERAARLMPFKLVCLPRALAGWRMLRRRAIPARLHFGAAAGQDGKPLRSHAWLDACGTEVTGFPEAHGCVEIGYYGP